MMIIGESEWHFNIIYEKEDFYYEVYRNSKKG